MPLPLFVASLLAIVMLSAGHDLHAQTLGDPLAPETPLTGLAKDRYQAGRLLFNGHWRPTGTEGPDALEGLGPFYNRIACSSCHALAGRGLPPTGPDVSFLTAILRIGALNPETGEVGPHPVFGTQIQDRAVPEFTPEASLSVSWEPVAGIYGDGTSYKLRRPVLEMDPPPGPTARWSIRVAQQVRGMGLIERAVTPRDMPGRFGWKAVSPSLVDQTADAFSRDMGITSRYRPDPICAPGQTECGGGPDEINGLRLMQVTDFLMHLSAPQPTGGSVPRGEALFSEIGCASCHIPSLPVRGSAASVFFYSDFSLHDMGPGLDDGLPEGAAKSFEWRTAPLWGLGALLARDPRMPLLHDGRARGAEEAILWHDGDAKEAADRFKALPAEDRAYLVAFLATL